MLGFLLSKIIELLLDPGIDQNTILVIIQKILEVYPKDAISNKHFTETTNNIRFLMRKTPLTQYKELYFLRKLMNILKVYLHAANTFL